VRHLDDGLLLAVHRALRGVEPTDVVEVELHERAALQGRVEPVLVDLHASLLPLGVLDDAPLDGGVFRHHGLLVEQRAVHVALERLVVRGGDEQHLLAEVEAHVVGDARDRLVRVVPAAEPL
jgi:Arc/MetJ family transcription regulator